MVSVQAMSLDALPKPTIETHGWNFLNSVLDLGERTIADLGLTYEQGMFVRPKFEYFEFGVELRYDNGDVRTHRASIVWSRPGLLPEHESLLHPWAVKGGLKYDLVLDLYEAAALSVIMMYRCAARGLHFYGAKGGIEIDSRMLSDTERERLGIAFAEKLLELGIVGPYKYVPASDVGTGPFDMDVIQTTLAPRFQECPHATITGKSLGKGGLPGRTQSTGEVCAACVHEYANILGIPAEGRTFAQQGLGKVGRHSFLRLVRLGWKPTMVSDIDGATFNPTGLDPVRLLEWFDAGKPISEYPGGVAYDRDSIIEADVTALILAAGEFAITGDNAHRVRAKIVGEAANFGITSAAEVVLARMPGVYVLPCEIAGSGGVDVSGKELALALGLFPGATISDPPTAEAVLELAVSEALRDLLSMVEVRRIYNLSTKMSGTGAGMVALLKAHNMMS